MKNNVKKINEWFNINANVLVIRLGILFSLGSFIFFYMHNTWNLSYVDATAHLNMSRKLFDNLTPGLVQLGGLWLPLLHILMIPTIWIDFMWQSGLSGYLVSGPAFVLSVYFVFKIVDLLFQDKKSAFLGALIYMSNINMLYLQTAAMMESLFNFTILGGAYFIVKWAKRNNIFDLILGGVFIAANTLTRYEGYGVFVMSVVAVFLVSLYKDKVSKKRKIIEGNLFLFVSVAILGLVFWMGYLGIIFGDPMHWLHPSRDVIGLNGTTTVEQQTIQSSGRYPFSEKSEVPRAYYYKDFSQSFLYLLNAMSNANGILLVIFSIIGLAIAVITSNRQKKYLVAIVAFVVLGPFVFLFASMYAGKVSVMGPFLWGGNIFNRSLNLLQEYGVRYTLSLLPFVAIFASVISLGKWYKKILLSLLIVFQVGAIFIGPLFLMSNLPLNWKKSYGKEIKYASWLKKNYNGGMILASALSNETGIFWIGVPYKYYIHEGNGEYYKKSLKDPAKYSTWIIMGSGGIIKNNLFESRVLYEKFDIVYDDGGTKIYKIKDKPKIDLLEVLNKK